MTQIFVAFWLVLAYDLLEDRRTIDVIITKFFPLRFERAESFENFINILHDWARDKIQKSLVETLNRYEKPEEERKSQFFLQKMTQEETLDQFLSAFPPKNTLSRI